MFMKDTNSMLKRSQLSIQEEIRSRPPIDFDAIILLLQLSITEC